MLLNDAWLIVQDAIRSLEIQADARLTQIHNNEPVKEAMIMLDREIQKIDENIYWKNKAIDLLDSLLYHEERGQGVGWSECLKEAALLVKINRKKSSES